MCRCQMRLTSMMPPWIVKRPVSVMTPTIIQGKTVSTAHQSLCAPSTIRSMIASCEITHMPKHLIVSFGDHTSSVSKMYLIGESDSWPLSWISRNCLYQWLLDARVYRDESQVRMPHVWGKIGILFLNLQSLYLK